MRIHELVPVHWTGKVETTLYLHINDQIASVPQGRQLRALEDRQLFAVLRQLVSPQAAERIITRVGLVGIRGLPVTTLEKSCDISRVAARRIKCARELASFFTYQETVIASSNAVIAHLPPGLASLETEVILGFALNAAMEVMGAYLLAKGGGSLVALSSRDVFVPMLRASASAIVLVHNHPSGDPTPSPEDVRFTRSVADAANILGIAFIDHLIVARSGITSMCEQGLLSARAPRMTTVNEP